MKKYGSPGAILDVVYNVRNSLVTMITATGADPTKARATARLLELDNNYIWSVAKVINADDILSIAGDIPTLKRIEALCEACRRKGAPDSAVESMLEAVRQFEHTVEVCAGDRESFSDLMSGLTYDDVTSRQEEARKMAFRGQSMLWGVRAKVVFKTAIVLPSPDKPDSIDLVRVGGLIGLRRFRPIPWTLFQLYARYDDGTPFKVKTEPLDPNIADSQELPILKKFSTDPLPAIKGSNTKLGKRFDISPGLIGNAGSVDCVFGDYSRNNSDVFASETDSHVNIVIDLQTPGEMLLFDIFLHKELTFSLPPEVIHIDRLNSASGFDTTSDETIDEWNRLPLSATVKRLMPGAVGCMTSHYPQYPQLMDYAFDTLGISQLEFNGYRFLMKYPTVPSTMLLRVPKLAKPEE